MAFEKTYRIYLMQGANFLYENGSGAISTSVTPIELQFAPENWKKIRLSLERGFTYYALMRLYSTEFNFVKDGAKILRWAYYTQKGVESKIKIKIEKFDTSISVYDYSTIIEEEIDFSEFLDIDDKVTVKIMEGGVPAMLKARESTMYEIPLANHVDKIWVKLDGLKLQVVHFWTPAQENYPQAFTAVYLPKNTYYDTEGVDTYTSQLTVDPISFQPYTLLNSGSAPTLSIEWRTKIRFNAIMDAGNSINGTLYVKYRLVNLAGPVYVGTTTIYTQSGLAPGSNTLVDLDLSNTISVPPGHAIEMQILVDNGSGGGGAGNNYEIQMLSNGTIQAVFDSIAVATYVPALRPSKVFEELSTLITDSEAFGTSNLLDTHSNKVITSGDGLRNLDNSVIKLSLADFWQSIDSVFCACLKYDKANAELQIDDRLAAFDASSVITTLTSVNNFKKRPFKSESFARLLAGFGSYTYDEVNGKDEFNQTTEYLFPMTRTTQQKDMKSVIRSDMYGIEYTRLNLTGKESTDADTDNDPFFLHIEDTPAGTIPAGLPGAGEDYYDLFRKPIDLTPGVNYWEILNIMYPETAFNIFFSAKRQLSRHDYWISSVFHLLGSEYLKFQVSTKNNNLALKLTTLEGSPVVTIDEQSAELISDYAPPLFYPILFEFDSYEPINLTDLVNANPFGIIRFVHKGSTYEGFPINISSCPSDLQTQNYVLLATSNNDLNELAGL